MQVCSKCQKENLVEVRFCGYCGNLLKIEPIQEKETPEKLQEIYERLSQIVKEELESPSGWECIRGRGNQILSLNEELQKCGNKYELLEERFLTLYDKEGKDGLNDFEKWELQKVESEMNEISNRILKIRFEHFNCVTISDMRREIELAFVEVSDWPIQMFKKIIQNHLIPHHSAQILAQYMPDENICMTESNQIQSTLRKNMHEYMLLLGDLQLIQQQGKNIIPQVQAEIGRAHV